MGAPRKPLPAQVIMGVVANAAEDLAEIRARVAQEFGPIDLESPVWPFDFTDYYAREMGAPLVRQFLAFERLVSPDGLHRLKIASNALEERLAAKSAAGVARPVNLDPGYLCHSKLVLFSTKDFSHRIYIAEGIFAEVTLEWRGGGFVTHPWTFPDYRTANYRNFLKLLRVNYVRKLEAWSP